MSIHKWKSMKIAREKGGFAGEPNASPLWDLSKRELIEIGLRLAGQCSGEAENIELAIKKMNDEFEILKSQGIV